MSLEEIRGSCSERRPKAVTDLRDKRAGGDWKALREAKAKSALETLS